MLMFIYRHVVIDMSILQCAICRGMSFITDACFLNYSLLKICISLQKLTLSMNVIALLKVLFYEDKTTIHLDT